MSFNKISEILEGYPIENGYRIQSINLGDTRKATSSCFAKVVRDIDVSENSGYAFIGDFIKTYKEIDLPNGTLLLVVRGEGSWKHPFSAAYLILIANSEPKIMFEGNWKNRITVRDKAKEILDFIRGANVEYEEAKKLITKAVALVGKEKVLEILKEVE